MKKLFLLSALSLPLILLWGCDFLTSSPKNINLDTIDLDSVVNSGEAMLSGAWNTAKEVGQEYYNDQIKPTVSTAIDTAKTEAEKLAQEAKSQVNSGIDQASQGFWDRIQEKAGNIAENIRVQIDGLKIK